MSECDKCGITDNEITHKQIKHYISNNILPKNVEGEKIGWWKEYASKKTINEDVKSIAEDWNNSFWEQTDSMFFAEDFEILCRMCDSKNK